MAFFIDENSCYFSLSLDPAGPNKAYVFPLTGPQSRIARTLLPASLVTAAATLGSMILIGLADYAGLTSRLLSTEKQTLLVCGLALAAATLVAVQVAWFLWVHNRFKSALSELERRSLGVLHLVRRPSLAAYWTFLLAMMVPLFGMAIFQRLDRPSASEVFSNVALIVPLGLGTTILTFVVIKRIVMIGAAHDAK